MIVAEDLVQARFDPTPTPERVEVSWLAMAASVVTVLLLGASLAALSMITERARDAEARRCDGSSLIGARQRAFAAVTVEIDALGTTSCT